MASSADGPAGDSATAAPSGSGIVNAVLAKKQPPPETPDVVWRRRYIVLSFWAVVLLLGFPIWWRTTTVYRAALPLEAMKAWADGTADPYSDSSHAQVCRPDISLPVDLYAGALSEQAETVLKETQRRLDQDNAHHRLTLGLAEDNEDRSVKRKTADTHTSDPAMGVRFIKDNSLSSPVSKLPPYAPYPVLEIKYPEAAAQGQNPTLTKFVADEINGIFAEERAMLARLVAQKPGNSQISDPTMSVDMSTELAKRRTRSMKYASTYHLTFSLFTPDAWPSDWDIEKALNDYMQPLLQALSPITKFTIDTQVQPYAKFSTSVHPIFNDERKTWMLKSSDLGGFINAAEWPLSPSIGAGPTINFILYVPSESQMPLQIEGGDSTSWLILQWGGIAIYNPSSRKTPQTLSAAEMEDVFFTFSQHLLDLLGLPSPDLPFQFRLETQKRLLAVQLMSSAASTMGSLARLTDQLPSISIPESVAESVAETLEELKKACDALGSGHFQEALDHARTADEAAEKAFFQRSMVGQVYFPDEHKVAVYLPLLGPIAVPLLMSAMRELGSLKKYLRRAKA